MRKGHISLLLRDFSYIMTFLRFQGEPSGFTSKDRILGGLRRRVEVQGSQEHQNKQGEARKRAKARTGVEAHVRALTTQHARPASNVARSGRAKCVAPGFYWFCDFLYGIFSFRFSSLFFLWLLGFLESGFERVKTLRLS